MSAKKILGGVLTVAGVLLISTGIGAPLGSIALGAGLGSLSVATLVGLGLEIGASLLLGPSVPSTPGSLANGGRDRLYATLDTTAPRKIVFGDTAAATDVRYQAFTGDKQEFYEDIIANASHQVEGQYQIWNDNEKAWESSGGVQGRYVGYLTVDARNPGTNANGIAIDTTWTTSCTLTGCAYLHLKYKLVGPDSSTPSPFQGGVSSRLTVRTKGALTYDPRLDSTVVGGSGPMRADDQTTWAWDDDGSRNPALQLLWYLLGWRINGKLAVGMGTPPARIDLESFITAANMCDEPVVLAAGGTEPRYRSDGVISEGDDRRSVVAALCGTMNATLRDGGGRLALQILHNDLATVAADFDKLDVLEDDEEWNQTQSIGDYFNIFRGTYTDASDNALYQPSDYPEVAIASPDGIDRIQSFDQPLVQSVTQAQRLAKLRLMRNQFQGTYSATFGKRAWQVSLGKVVRQSHPGLSWDKKLFRVAAQSISRTGPTKLTLIEEDASIYDWDAAVDERSGITAGTPPVADPANDPLLPNTTADISALIANSRVLNPDPTTPILTASENTIFIKDHERVYSDKTVPVTGTGTGLILTESSSTILAESGTALQTESGSGSGVAGETAGLTYYVGYSDEARAGGTEAYIASTDVNDVTNSGVGGALPFMHYLGAIQMAAAGSGMTTSGAVAAPSGFTGFGGAGSGAFQ